MPNPEAYSEPCQASEFLEKHLMAFSSWQFSRKAPFTFCLGFECVSAIHGKEYADQMKSSIPL